MRYYKKRMEGALAPLIGDKIPKRYIFFDTETTVPLKDNDIREFNLILGVAIFVELTDDLEIKQQVRYDFTSSDEFIDIIKYHNRSKQLLHVFAHNIGFDIRVLDLPNRFNEIGFASEPPIINQMAFIWRVKSETGTYLFLDTANLGVRSVSSLGADIGYEKRKIEFNASNLDDLREYCFVDVDILKSFVIEYVRFVSIHNLGSFKVTLASQSLTAFRTSFMVNPPYIHNDDRAIKLERAAYHGGRVECFRLGIQDKRNWFYLDVNSMYPYVMLGDDLPIQYLGYSENVSFKEFKIRIKKYYLIADVLIDTDEPLYPLLRNDKLIFPIGKFRTTLNHHELVYAYKHGHVKKIYSSAQYKMGSIFDRYVNFFYDLKTSATENNNKLWRTISKLFLNSLYGKFGQTEPHREPYGECAYKGVFREPTYDTVLGMHYQYIGWYGQLYKEYRNGETTFSCPYLAAAITSKARMLLWMYIKQADRQNVIYCDTDSLIVNARGYRNLLPSVSKTRLGALKLEAQSQHFELYGNKDYVFGQDVKHKGLPSTAQKIDQNKWEYLEFEGMLKWLNRGAQGAPKATFRTKSRKTNYNKGIINEDYTVSPFVLNEGDSFSIVLVH